MPDAVEPSLSDTADDQHRSFERSRNGLLTMRETMARVRYSRPSVYRLIRDEQFPRPLKMTSAGRILFRERDVEAWLASRPIAL